MNHDNVIEMFPRAKHDGIEEIKELADDIDVNIKSKLRVLLDRTIASTTLDKSEVKDLALLFEMAMDVVKDLHHGDELITNVAVDRINGTMGKGVLITILFAIPTGPNALDLVMGLRLHTTDVNVQSFRAHIESDGKKLTHRDDSKFSKLNFINVHANLINMLTYGVDSGFYTNEKESVSPNATRYVGAKRIGDNRVALISLNGDNGATIPI